MDLEFDADAVRGLRRDTDRLTQSLALEARSAEASLSDVSSGIGHDDIQTVVDELLRTLRSAHSGVVQGLMGFAVELEMTAQAFDAADAQLASRVPTD